MTPTQGFTHSAKSAIHNLYANPSTACRSVDSLIAYFLFKPFAKVAKFALKVVSTAASVVGRVISFIPGVGKVVGKDFYGISKGLDVASNAIPAKLDPKLEKGMAIMPKIQRPVSGAAGAALDAILKRDLGEPLSRT